MFMHDLRAPLTAHSPKTHHNIVLFAPADRRPHSTLVCFSALLALALYFATFLWLAPRIFWTAPDFACFYRAGRMVLRGAGAQVYDLPPHQRFESMLAAE